MEATGNGETSEPGRANLTRLVRALARLSRAPARLSVLASPSARVPSGAWRALPGGGRALEAVVPAGAACSPRQAEALARTLLAEAGPGAPYPPAPPARAGKVLLFRCLLEAPGKEGAERLNQGTFYLASSLLAEGHRVVLSDARVTRWARDRRERDALSRLLDEHPDLDLAAISLYDAYFEEAAALVEFLRGRTKARVAVGALMPTRDPETAFVHLPGADVVARGAGEDLLPRLAGLAPVWTDEGARGALLELDGVLAGEAGRWAVWASAGTIRRVADLDASVLDFSLYERRDAQAGPAFCLSRGCDSACAFCTSPDRGLFHGKSAAGVGRTLAAYGRRLRQLYGSWSAVPRLALSVGFYDDDFLADRDRALAVLRVVARSPFRLRFLQASVRSFFRPDGELDSELLDGLPAELFDPDAAPQLYLGTESFCDAELRRLGKGYGVERVERLARELSRRGLRQAHHFIASNARTRPADAAESLARIVRLRRECGPAFAVLEPVIAHLVSFPGTASLAALRRAGLEDRALRRGVLKVPGYPEFDYPLMERDEPADPDVAAWAARLKAQGAGLDWEAELESLCLDWLLLSERLDASGEDPRRAARLRAAVDAAARLAWEAA